MLRFDQFVVVNRTVGVLLVVVRHLAAVAAHHDGRSDALKVAQERGVELAYTGGVEDAEGCAGVGVEQQTDLDRADPFRGANEARRLIAQVHEALLHFEDRWDSRDPDGVLQHEVREQSLARPIGTPPSKIFGWTLAVMMILIRSAHEMREVLVWCRLC